MQNQLLRYRNRILSIGLFGTIVLLWSALPSTAATGREIMDQQKARHESTTESEKVKMVLVDSSGKTETREMVRFAKKGPDGLYKYLVQFQSPADVRGVGLLTWQQKGREDDQWLYMPALGEKLKRIAGGGKKSYFMGTDFAYEDLRNEKLDDHVYNLLGGEKVSDKDCHKIEALPGNDEEKRTSGYSKRILWITKDTLVTLQVEYYDQNGKLMKTAKSYDIKEAKGQMMRANKVLMDHHQNKHQTVMGTLERKVDEPIDDATFTERYVLGGGK
jgi:outer membrane lipoprotein-sorting protein